MSTIPIAHPLWCRCEQCRQPVAYAITIEELVRKAWERCRRERQLRDHDPGDEDRSE